VPPQSATSPLTLRAIQGSAACALIIAGSEGSLAAAAAPAGGSINWLSFTQAVVAATLSQMMYKRWLKTPSNLEFPVVCAASVGMAGVFLLRALAPLAGGGKAKQ
jgi:hypothetical protein